MAAPQIGSDLTDINLAESTTGWSALGGGGAGLSVEPDFFIQGNNCIAKQVKNELKGHHYNNGATTQGADDHVFVWIYVSTPGTTDLLANGGLRVTIGTSDTARKEYYVAGSDTYAFGGWVCYPVSYSITPDNTIGSPGATPSFFGATMNGTASVKSVNLGIDAIRYGSWVGLINGDSTTPATFAFADSTFLRYGLTQRIAGGLQIQGKLRIGVPLAPPGFCFFEDNNQLVLFPNNRGKTTVGFKEVIIDDSATEVSWTAITFLSNDPLDKGKITVTTSNSTAITGCTFQALSTTSLHSSVTVATSTWVNCETVTANQATFTGCTFDGIISASSVITDDLGDLDDCTFVSDGSNHAIELTSVGTGSYTWDYTTTGYAPGTLGVEGTDFTAGSTGNETLYINATSSQNITLTIPSGITTPSIRRGASYTGTITLEAQAKTIDVNVKDADGVNVVGAFVYINDGVTTIFNGITDASGNIPQQSYSGTNNSTLRVRRFGDKPFETTLGTASGSVSQLVTLIDDRQQVAVPTLNQTYTINTSGSTITVSGGSGSVVHTDYTTLDTAQDIYEFVMNTFAATAFMQFPVPFESITDNQYNFINGYTFGAKDVDYKYIYQGSFTDSANNLLWSNVRTIGTQESGTSIYIVQGVEASDTALTSWWPDGNINVLVKVQDGTFIQSTDDTATNVDGAVWLFAREYGDLYDHFFTDLSNGGQNIVALSTSPDLNNTTASGTVAGYTDVITTFGSTSQDIGDGNGNQPYAVIVNCNGRTLKEVYERTKYITSFDFSQTVNGDDGFEYRNADEANFSNADNKQAPFGTFAGGRFFGARGVFLTNVASSDITNYELIDSNGVARFPPLQVAFSLTGLKDATEVRIFNSTTDTEIAGVEDITNGTDVGGTASAGVTVSGSTDNNTFVYTYTYSSDIPIFVVILSLGLQITRLSNLTLGNTSQSIPVSQVIDRVYNNPP